MVEDPEAEEAYAAYVDARRRFNEIKTNRGFYPIVALGLETSTGGITMSGQRPVPLSSPSKGKSKGKSKGGSRPS